MQDNIAIKVENLSKVYQKKRKDGMQEDFYALKDVNFAVKKGEVVGIIGKNGSGKSTLLKILSGVTKPTKGTVEINGTVASILDVGTGFHQDLSGRENVYLRGKLLGMTTKEIDEAFDEIVDFSEIGDFIDTPVKNYSSGMFLRLAFSILVFLKCDILLLDEVMAVGDVNFREKSRFKLLDLIKQNKTIIVVSHNFSQLHSIVQKCFLIEKGSLCFHEKIDNAINTFNVEEKREIPIEIVNTYNDQKQLSKSFDFDSDILIVLSNIEIKTENTFFSIRIRDIVDNNIIVASPFLSDNRIKNIRKDYYYSFVINRNILNQGIYYIDLIYSNSDKILKIHKSISDFEIHNNIKTDVKHYGANSLLKLNLIWSESKTIVL